MKKPSRYIYPPGRVVLTRIARAMGYGSAAYPPIAISESTLKRALRNEASALSTRDLLDDVIRSVLGPIYLGFGPNRGDLIDGIQQAMDQYDRLVGIVNSEEGLATPAPVGAVPILRVAAVHFGCLLGAGAILRGTRDPEELVNPFALDAFGDYFGRILQQRWPDLPWVERYAQVDLDKKKGARWRTRAPGKGFQFDWLASVAEKIAVDDAERARLHMNLRWLAGCARLRRELDRYLGAISDGRRWVDDLASLAMTFARNTCSVMAETGYAASEFRAIGGALVSDEVGELAKTGWLKLIRILADMPGLAALDFGLEGDEVTLCRRVSARLLAIADQTEVLPTLLFHIACCGLFGLRFPMLSLRLVNGDVHREVQLDFLCGASHNGERLVVYHHEIRRILEESKPGFGDGALEAYLSFAMEPAQHLLRVVQADAVFQELLVAGRTLDAVAHLNAGFANDFARTPFLGAAAGLPESVANPNWDLENPEHCLAAALSATRERRHKDAMVLLQRAITLDGNDPDALFLLLSTVSGDLERLLSKASRMMLALDQVSDDDPVWDELDLDDHLDASFELAGDLFGLLDFGLEHLHDVGPHRDTYLLQRLHIRLRWEVFLLGSCDWDDANADADASVEELEEDADFVAERLQSVRAIAEDLQLLVERRPRDGRCLMLLALCFRIVGDASRALTLERQAALCGYPLSGFTTR